MATSDIQDKRYQCAANASETASWASIYQKMVLQAKAGMMKSTWLDCFTAAGQQRDTAIVLVLGILLLAFVWSTLRVRFKHLADYPGPSIAAYTRLWLCKVICGGNSANIIVEINKRYGSIARIGPNHLVTDDPELVQRICGARTPYVRAPWYDSLRIDPRMTNIVSERHHGAHNHLRHQMSSGYSMSHLKPRESVITERIAEFTDWLGTKAVRPGEVQTPVDLGRPVQYLTVDIISHLICGKPLGFVREGQDLFKFLWTIEHGLPVAQVASVFSELSWLAHKMVLVPFLRPLVSPSVKDESGIGVTMRIAREQIEKRSIAGAALSDDMLAAFIKHGMTADNAETELSIALVAGSDTTATTIRSTLLMLTSNFRVYQKLQQEIDAAAARGEISSPVTDEEARALPYLQACLKEGLRRHPPITQLRERMCPPEGDVYKGQNIPAGTFVGINAWGLQLSPVFGDDPATFRPERWLEASPEQLRKMNSIHELIFGHGPTRCLGIPIASMNLNKVFVELFRRFDFSTADPTRPWRSRCYGIFFQREFNVIVTHRENPV